MNLIPPVPNLIISIVNLVCCILIVLKIWVLKGPFHTLIGLFFPIYSFFWGWNNTRSKKDICIMAVWSTSTAIQMSLIVIYS